MADDDLLGPLLAGVVVVGVEPSIGARAALEYGLAEGRRRGVAVHVVAVYQPTDSWLWALAAAGPGALGEDPDVNLSVVEQGVAELVDAVRGSLFDNGAVDVAPVELHTVLGQPSQVLIESTAQAAVLVVGHPGRGTIGSALFGSVALSCASNAHCPVSVVPPASSAEQT